MNEACGANASADLMATRPRVALSPARALALRPAQGCGRRLRARLAGGRQAARRPRPASRRAIVAAANAIFVGVVEYTYHLQPLMSTFEQCTLCEQRRRLKREVGSTGEAARERGATAAAVAGLAPGAKKLRGGTKERYFGSFPFRKPQHCKLPSAQVEKIPRASFRLT